MCAPVLLTHRSTNSSCDAWGNIRIAAVKVIEETHEENFVRLFIHEVCGAFYFGYQIQVGKTVRQKSANINDRSFEKKELARIYGCMEIQSTCNSNKNTRKLFAEFNRIANAQQELFPQED
jgi:hypothetical protein